MADLPALTYLAALAAVALVGFWDAPIRLMRAMRGGRVLQDPTYHAVNTLSVLVIAGWLAAILVGADLRVLDTADDARPFLRWTGAVLAVAGAVFALWGKFALGDAFVPTAAVVPGQGVVDGGPYALVRHPFYVGLVVTMAAGVLALDSLATLVALVVMLPLVRTVAVMEERHLEAELGEPYRAYCERVSRWVP